MRKKLFPLLLMLLALACASAQAQDATGIAGYSKASGYEYVSFGTYHTDADGTERPILWRVLRSANGEAYLLSEYILFASPVHADYQHYDGWENSDLYAYLNGEFKTDAFTAAEQQALICRTEDNALVTLISGDELRDASIGFANNNARLCESTAWAKRERPENKKLQLMIYSKGHKYSPWWSRTRSTDNPKQQRRVMDEGNTGRLSVGNPDMGVRPAINVDLSLLIIAGGNGTMASPYQLEPMNTAIAENPTTVPAANETAAPEETTAVHIATIVTAPPVTAAPAAASSIVAMPGSNNAQENTTAAPAATEAPAVVAGAAAGYTAAGQAAHIHAGFPSLTQQGFLPEGESEFVSKDEANGVWLYASQTLRIQIVRKTGVNSKNQPLRWYEAEIFTRDASELFDLFPYNEAKYMNRYALALADEIAVTHRLVFAINSDYFIYRVSRDAEEKYDYPIGTIIRDGKIFYDRPRKATSTVYPPLDVMALYPDGSVQLFYNGEKTAEEILATGATDTLAFGPILVENGQVAARSREFGSTPNPRTAFGMVEPGYYIAVMVESRISESKGESCVWMGEKMAELGCQSAINLDGGATSTMIFMGKQINKSGNYGDITNRKQNELLGIGHSDAVK